MTQMTHENANINSNKHLILVKSKQNKNFSLKKLQGFLSNYGIVLASQKTLASIASVVLYLLERPNPYRVKYGKTMTAEEPITMKDL